MSTHEDLARVAAVIRLRVPELVERIQRRSRAEVPQFYAGDDPGLTALEGPAIADSLSDILDGLSERLEAPQHVPVGALKEAKTAAQAGIDLNDLIRTYRVGQAVTWDCLMEVSNTIIEEPEQRLEVLRRAAAYHFDWNDTVVAGVIEAYQEEYKAFYFKSRDRKRRAIIRDILRGLTVDADSLNYTFRGQHLGVVAWGESAESAVQQIGSLLGGEQVSITGTDGTVLSWVHNGQLANRLVRVGARFSPPNGSYVAIGDIASGLDGFRLTHRQAWQAYRVGRILRSPYTRYADVALEALALRDTQSARDYVQYILGPLDPQDSRSQVLLETLEAYFASGQNGALTSQKLAVHERTVAYRLKSIEQKLGVHVSSRRDELSSALRFARILKAGDALGVTDTLDEDGSNPPI
ncbi:MAG: helix-turn-helix domain-containing protein [Actinobacteria bacterium]|nr:helix-turn-helix domain-containing protein [Actinomycetota bacterium]